MQEKLQNIIKIVLIPQTYKPNYCVLDIAEIPSIMTFILNLLIYNNENNTWGWGWIDPSKS